jgi:centromere protein C
VLSRAGNHYSIENVSPDVEAKLFFAQARKLRLNEAEDEALQVLSQPQTARGSATPNERRNGGLPPVAEDGGDEQGQEAQEVDEEEETPRRKKAKSKGKRR